MVLKRFAQQAMRAGARRAAGFVTRKLADPEARSAVTSLLTGQQPTRTLSKQPVSQAESRGGRPGRRQSSKNQPSKQSEQARPPAERPAAAAPIGADPRGGEFTPARQASRTRPRQNFPRRPSGGYPGDYVGRVRPVYSPDLDGEPDPGEIVWGWVPFEEDHKRGKDRPVLIIGRDDRWLLALMLTSKDNVPGAVGEVWEDEHARYINIGAGDWDSQRRPSEVRLDRVVRISDDAVRREGSVMPMELFSRIVSEVRPG
ncbi:type II toxin-antitoxin system PemK/MazF family toxin [Brevibacterium daeguense]|nr:type II toxin-antitoxin system PemK/MazF family toxin [Brevibacterium daeguense]